MSTGLTHRYFEGNHPKPTLASAVAAPSPLTFYTLPRIRWLSSPPALPWTAGTFVGTGKGAATVAAAGVNANGASAAGVDVIGGVEAPI